MAKTKSFASDLATILAGVGATITVALPRGGEGEGESTTSTQEMDVLAFLGCAVPAGTLLQSVFIPFAKEGVFYNSYKVALRPQNSHALVNAAFYVSTSPAAASAPSAAATNCVIVDDIRLVYGVVETKHAVRASEVEALLKGKELNKTNCEAALRAVSTSVAIAVPEAHRLAHRTQLIWVYLLKFLAGILAETTGEVLTAVGEVLELPLSGSGPARPRAVSTGTQHVTVSAAQSSEHFPVSQPQAKLSAPLQASGEAKSVTLPLRRPVPLFHTINPVLDRTHVGCAAARRCSSLCSPSSGVLPCVLPCVLVCYCADVLLRVCADGNVTLRMCR